MSGKLIAQIYFYVISAAATALIVVGIFNIVNFTINTTQYDQYPLNYQPIDCERFPGKYGYDAPIPVVIPGNPQSTPSADELQQQKQQCEEQQAAERKKQRLDDLKSSVTFTLVGVVLFLIHFPQARKHSK